MSDLADPRIGRPEPGVVLALGEEALFLAGDRVRVLTRQPIGHYRVPRYLRGKTGVVEAVIEPTMLDNEEEAYGRNAGMRRGVGGARGERWSASSPTTSAGSRPSPISFSRRGSSRRPSSPARWRRSNVASAQIREPRMTPRELAPLVLVAAGQAAHLTLRGPSGLCR